MRYTAWSAAGASGRSSPERRSSTGAPALLDDATSASTPATPRAGGAPAVSGPGPGTGTGPEAGAGGSSTSSRRMPTASRSSRIADLAASRRMPTLPRPVPELGVHLQRPRVHGDQGELVAEAVVHVLGDALPLQQARLPRHHRLLTHQLGVVPAQRLQQVTALGAVPGGEPRHDRQHQIGARAQRRRRQQRQLQRLLTPALEQTARDVQHHSGGVRAATARQGRLMRLPADQLA